jgi:hypothetical protein
MRRTPPSTFASFLPQILKLLRFSILRYRQNQCFCASLSVFHGRLLVLLVGVSLAAAIRNRQRLAHRLLAVALFSLLRIPTMPAGYSDLIPATIPI